MNLTSTQLYLRLLGYVKPFWRVFALSIVAMAITAATEPLLPALLKPMLDGTFVNKDDTIIRLTPIIILVIFLVRGIASFVATYAIGWVGFKLVMALREEMFRKLLNLPTRHYDDNATGSMISKLVYDVNYVATAATTVVTVLVRDSIIIIGLLGWLFYLDWKLTLLSLLMVPPIAWAVKILNVKLRDASTESMRMMGELTQVVEESVAGHKVVKLFGGQQYEQGRFGDRANWLRRYMMKFTMAAAANVPIVQMFAAIALAVIIYIATQQTSGNASTVGGFLSFIAAMLMLTAPLKRLTGVSEHLQQGLAAAESVFGLIDTVTEKDEGQVTLEQAQGNLRFEHVSMVYEGSDRLSLDDVDLDIPAGQSVALVGQSGSGKTTLANLVPRFYTPTAGRILLDGHDISDLTLASLRNNIALVSQEVVLFNDTVAANIAYGAMRAASEAEIIAAAQAAHAMDFIREMPQGLNTLIGERGAKLSGGQRQRISIARAILKNAPILILDEATSALDSESERHVQAALETLMKGRTSIIIAHRLSTIEKADRIVVLQKGKICETGRHADLIAQGGIYANLHQMHASAEGTGI